MQVPECDQDEEMPHFVDESGNALRREGQSMDGSFPESFRTNRNGKKPEQVESGITFPVPPKFRTNGKNRQPERHGVDRPLPPNFVESMKRQEAEVHRSLASQGKGRGKLTLNGAGRQMMKKPQRPGYGGDRRTQDQEKDGKRTKFDNVIAVADMFTKKPMAGWNSYTPGWEKQPPSLDASVEVKNGNLDFQGSDAIKKSLPLRGLPISAKQTQQTGKWSREFGELCCHGMCKICGDLTTRK